MNVNATLYKRHVPAGIKEMCRILVKKEYFTFVRFEN